MTRVYAERTIAAPPEPVFDWLADPANLTTARLMLRAHWDTGTTGPGLGAVRVATAAALWVREEFTGYDRPHSYSYLIVRVFPPMRHQGGTLTFTPVAGGTHVEWESTFTHPVWVGGRATEAFTSRLLRQGFGEILAGCASSLED